jgi:uncharacterized protein (TIGR00297 family)
VRFGGNDTTVTSQLRRSGAYAAAGTLALAAPSLGTAAAAPFAALAVLAVLVVDEGPLFELFARPGDHEDGQLNGLAAFALAATGLAILTIVPGTAALPTDAFVAAVLVVSYGNLGAAIAEALPGRSGDDPPSPTPGSVDADDADQGRIDPEVAAAAGVDPQAAVPFEPEDDPFRPVLGFLVGGSVAGIAGMVAVAWSFGTAITLPRFVVMAAAGSLVAALLRTVLYERDDPWVMLSAGLLLGLLSPLVGTVPPVEAALAVGVSAALAYVSYLLGAASVAGMLTGAALALLTVVLGGVGWFAVLVTFFGIGSLSTKFRYEAKLRRGVAEENEGARGTTNVLANAAVALVSVIGFAAAPLVSATVAVDPLLFQFAFAGSLATAMADTLSSEVGGLFDNPRLITTLNPVPPGTDGAVTWQGELAGVLGAALIAGVTVLVMVPSSTPVTAGIVVAGGVAGMTVDSVLGATIEGDTIGNEAVNFAATLVGGLVAAGLAVVV